MLLLECLVERSIYDRAVKEAVDEANLIKVDHASKERRPYWTSSF